MICPIGIMKIRHNSVSFNRHLHECDLYYEGESNENLKIAIQIRNTAQLSYNLTKMMLMTLIITPTNALI